MVNSVTFPSSLGGDNSTVDDSNSPTTGLGNNGHRTRFIPALSQTVVMAQTAVTGASNAAASAATASGAATTATTKASEAAASASAADASASAAEASALSASNDADAVAAGLALIAGGPVASINGKTGIATLNASEVPSTPTGNIAATNTQAAIAELDSEKASKDGTETLTNKTLATPTVTIGGSYGVGGQVLASQGAGLPLAWTTPYSPHSGVGFVEVVSTFASYNFIVPDGVTTIRAYAGGAGAAGTTTNGGGGGGMAFGDIAVTSGETISCTISTGIARVLRGAVELLRGNPASGTSGGTAVKHASVTSGGAFMGGSGGTQNSSGASSGSPLGNGYNGIISGGGAGIGGGGGGGGGGGSGGAGSATYGGGAGGSATSTTSGPSRLIKFSDPLLQRCVGMGGSPYSVHGQDGGGGSLLSGVISGNGGFGGGGGCGAAASLPAGDGGALGGGGAHSNGIGGNGGVCGGGGRGSSSGGAGGSACIWIYYQ